MKLARALFAVVCAAVVLGVGHAAADAQEGTVTVQTVPPLSGVTVRLDEAIGETNEQGFVALSVENGARAVERLEVVDSDIARDDEGLRARYTRLYRVDRDSLAIAFEVDRPVTFAYQDTNGNLIEPSQLSSMQLKNTVGAVMDDAPLDEPIWLLASRVVSTQRGPEVRDVEWSISEILVNGSNVVNRSQVRFFPSTQDHIDVTVLFFSAKFLVADLLFGYRHNGTIELTYPSGLVERHELVNGELELESLPRGKYDVLVVGSGPLIARPVQLSRNQELELELLSWADLIFIGISGVVFLLVPLTLGRRWWRSRAQTVNQRPRS